VAAGRAPRAIASSSSVGTRGESGNAVSSSSPQHPPAAAWRASPDRRTRRRAPPPGPAQLPGPPTEPESVYGERLYQRSLLPEPTRGPPEPPPARGRLIGVHEPAPRPPPTSPRPFNQALADGEDAAPGAPQSATRTGLLDTWAPREPLDVEEHSRRYPLDLDAHPRQARLRGPLRVATTLSTRLDADEQPLIQETTMKKTALSSASAAAEPASMTSYGKRRRPARSIASASRPSTTSPGRGSPQPQGGPRRTMSPVSKRTSGLPSSPSVVTTSCASPPGPTGISSQ